MAGLYLRDLELPAGASSMLFADGDVGKIVDILSAVRSTAVVASA